MPSRTLRVLALILFVLSLGAFGGCANEHPNTLPVLDFQPREVDVGDRLEIIGTSFPLNRKAIVTFAGKLHRPGKLAEDAVISVQGEATSAERIDLLFSEALADQFCGGGDSALHTTFRGSISVRFEGAAGGPALEGVLGAVVVDFRAPTARHFSVAQGEETGRAVLKFMGIEAAPATEYAVTLNDGGVVSGRVVSPRFAIVHDADGKPLEGNPQDAPLLVRRDFIENDLQISPVPLTASLLQAQVASIASAKAASVAPAASAKGEEAEETTPDPTRCSNEEPLVGTECEEKGLLCEYGIGRVACAQREKGLAWTLRSLNVVVELPNGEQRVVSASDVKDIATGTFSQVASGGLLVAAVKPGAPADIAGVHAWDVIVEVDGVHVNSVADVIPAGSTLTNLGLRRPNEEGVRTVQVSMRGFKQTIPAELLGAALVVGIAAAILLLFMAPTAGIITWVERRVSARMQSRIGPNRAGPGGFVVWLADGIKSIMKEDIIPTESDHILFRLAPYLVFMGVSATFVVMPFGQKLIAADLDIGILYIVAITSLVTIGLLTAGWASNNKWSLLGGIRAAAQIISYEIPGAVAVVCIVMMTGSLRLQDIIRAQGGLPWDWYMFRNPVTFILFFLYFTTALAEGNRAPFDLPEAESELVAGYSTEYSGMRYLFFFFAEWANVFVMSGIATALFLGGWQVPFVDPLQQEASMGLQALGAIVFLGKAWILVFVIVWIRWTLPRVRIDQMMNMCWKYFVPFSFLAFVLTALWVLWSPGEWARLIGVAMFALWCAIVIYFFRRVVYNLKTISTHHLSPHA